MEFKFSVSTDEIKTVKKLLEVANICCQSDFEESRILGEIFSKKLSSGFANLTWNYGVIQVINQVVVTVEGTRTVKKTDKKTGKNNFEEIPAKEKVTIQVVPVQFENFMLDGNIVTFTMKRNKEELKDATILARVPEKTIKNINDSKISVEYPSNDIKTEAYWEEFFQKAESKISASSRNTLIVRTFDVLKQRGKFPIYGRDVLEVRKMYYYCMEHFPKFATFPLEYRLDYLNEGIGLAKRDAVRISSDKLLGPHIIAKGITKALMARNLHSTYGKNKIYKTYYKYGPSKEMENIRFISYIKPDGRNTSFSPFAIWHEMAGSYDEESVSNNS